MISASVYSICYPQLPHNNLVYSLFLVWLTSQAEAADGLEILPGVAALLEKLQAGGFVCWYLHSVAAHCPTSL